MKQSQEIDKLAAALAKAQSAFTTVIADCTVDYKTKSGMRINYKYATLPAVMSMIRKPLSDNGLAILQATEANVITTILVHESGQFVSVETPLPGMSDGDIKAFGSNISYIRRYAISPLVGVVVSDEDNEVATDGKIDTTGDGSGNKEPKHETSEQKEKLHRPMSPADIKKSAARRTMTSTGPADGAQIEVAWKTLLAAVNGDVAFADDITNYLFGFRGLDDTTTNEQVKFVLSWSGATLENGYEPSDHMKSEALWILKQVAVEAGQKELFTPPDFDSVEEAHF